ncbi:hypothetical protein ACEK07_39545 [Alcanivoracaceae bacterium MT1]
MNDSRFFLLIFIGFSVTLSLFASACSGADEISVEVGCLSGAKVKKDLSVGGQIKGRMTFSAACLDQYSGGGLPPNPRRNLPGSVSVVFCGPGYEACPESNRRGDVRVTFTMPDKYIFDKYLKDVQRGEKVGSNNKYEIYADSERKGGRRIYVSRSGAEFVVRCLEESFGECNMIGVVSDGVQYFLNVDYDGVNPDWEGVHKKMATFVGGALASF